VTRLESTGDELLPDVREVLLLSSKEIDALSWKVGSVPMLGCIAWRRTTRDLGIETIFFRDLSNHDETFGGDLASGDPGDDREGAVPLDVGQESAGKMIRRRRERGRRDGPIVGVLERVVLGLHDVLVEERGEDTCDGGLADLATLRSRYSCDVHDGVEVAEILDLDDLEEIDS
jgi:hypothetical protein